MANASYHNVSLVPFWIRTEFGIKCWVNRVFVGYQPTEDAARALTTSIIDRVTAELAENAHGSLDLMIAEAAQDAAEDAEDSDARYEEDYAETSRAWGHPVGAVERGDAVRR